MMQNTRIGGVAKILGVSTQTIRNWLALDVEKNFSSSALLKTKKRFSSFDIEQLQRIQALLKEGHFLDEIPVKLPPAQPVVEVEVIEDAPTHQVIEDEPTEQSQTTDIQQLDLYENFLELLKQQGETFEKTIQAKDDLISELKEDKQRLQDEKQSLKDDLESARLPWWKRLIS